MPPVPEARRFGGAFERTGNGRLKAIAFRSLGELRADDWKGREDVQFPIDDGAAAAG